MGINVGMLIFGLFDGGLAYAIVYCLMKAWWKGKKIGQILGTVLGILVFSGYIGLFVYFNTDGVSVNTDFRNLVYAAPIVLAILLGVLVFLSQPPKQAEDKEDADEEETAGTTGEENQ
jgi:hypothetical protein